MGLEPIHTVIPSSVPKSWLYPSAFVAKVRKQIETTKYLTKKSEQSMELSKYFTSEIATVNRSGLERSKWRMLWPQRTGRGSHDKGCLHRRRQKGGEMKSKHPCADSAQRWNWEINGLHVKSKELFYTFTLWHDYYPVIQRFRCWIFDVFWMYFCM